EGSAPGSDREGSGGKASGGVAVVLGVVRDGPDGIGDEEEGAEAAARETEGSIGPGAGAAPESSPPEASGVGWPTGTDGPTGAGGAPRVPKGAGKSGLISGGVAPGISRGCTGSETG